MYEYIKLISESINTNFVFFKNAQYGLKRLCKWLPSFLKGGWPNYRSRGSNKSGEYLVPKRVLILNCKTRSYRHGEQDRKSKNL